MKKLPKTVFVAWQGSVIASGEAFLSAETDPAALIEDDGPTIVGTYRLVEQRKLRKVVEGEQVR